MASAGRDHVIEMPKWCSAVLCLDLLVMTAILNLLFPYKGPEDTMPYLHRFTIFVAICTFAAGLYYLITYHLFWPAYNCWVWVICGIWQLLASILHWAYAMSYEENLDLGRKPVNEHLRRNDRRLVIMLALSSVRVVLWLVNTLYYSKAVYRHFISRRPYIYHGRWRSYLRHPAGGQLFTGDRAATTTTVPSHSGPENDKANVRSPIPRPSTIPVRPPRPVGGVFEMQRYSRQAERPVLAV